MRAAADRVASHGPPTPRRRAGRRGFTLLEVLFAMALLLIGGVCVMSVFTLALVHGVERAVTAKLDLLRPEALTLAQQAVDAAGAGTAKAPQPIRDQEMSQAGFRLT